MHPTKFRFIGQSPFRGEDFQKSTNQKQELPVVAMIVSESGRNEQSLQRTFQGCFLLNYWFILKSGFRGENYQEIDQPEEIIACDCHMFVNGSRRNGQSLLMFPIKFRFIWESGFRGEDFQTSTNQKQELAVTAMFVNRQRRLEQSLQRTFKECFLLSFDSFAQAVSEEKIFLKIDQSETRITCDGHVC